MTSREVLNEKVKLHLFPGLPFQSKLLNQPSKRLLSDIKYACKLFVIYSVLILISIVAFFAYDNEPWLHLTIKNSALVFALGVILCVTHIVVDTVASYYNSLCSPYDMIIRDINYSYGLKLFTFTYALCLLVLLLFVFLFLFTLTREDESIRRAVMRETKRDGQDPWKSFFLFAFAGLQDEHFQRDIMQELELDLQFPWESIKYCLLWLFELAAKGCILRFTMYIIVTCRIFGRYGLYVSSTEVEQKISLATFFAIWLWYSAFVSYENKIDRASSVILLISFCIQTIFYYDPNSEITL